MTNRTHTTGSRRDSRNGKGRFDLISPIVDQLLAKHMEAGAVKYGDRNWEIGQPLSWYLDSAKRHEANVREGLTDEDHAVAALWNWHAFIHTREMIRRGVLPKELDDMPRYVGVDNVRQQAQASPSWPDGIPQVQGAWDGDTPVWRDDSGGIAGDGEGWSIRGDSPLR